ncbi:hypothetical protein GCM10018980_61070 [Streptomyces capoamus]|uniref:Uncharacterized protein n=1 Tax=Streptomyces capoamus TaxID=68183 RepID=A0A919F171_9ACTN|nr:hypothetical protein GCM10010501_47050 [Streptomyces libani subsp. rufus]GHG67878.1 hypothetical protein GCM10018980_61070 [Streptomyces capoamus]
MRGIGAPGRPLRRPTVTPEGSTHVGRAFTGTTSSVSRTASANLAAAVPRPPRVFAQPPPWRTPACARPQPGYTAAYATGSLPGTGSARPSFTRRRRWDSASETAMVREP